MGDETVLWLFVIGDKMLQASIHHVHHNFHAVWSLILCGRWCRIFSSFHDSPHWLLAFPSDSVSSETQCHTPPRNGGRNRVCCLLMCGSFLPLFLLQPLICACLWYFWSNLRRLLMNPDIVPEIPRDVIQHLPGKWQQTAFVECQPGWTWMVIGSIIGMMAKSAEYHGVSHVFFNHGTRIFLYVFLSSKFGMTINAAACSSHWPCPSAFPTAQNGLKEAFRNCPLLSLFWETQGPKNVGSPRINLPFGNGLYMFISPIHCNFGMVYCWVYHGLPP